jgi:hypothetical protein
MATIDEFVLKNIGLWWRYRISWHCDEWKYIIIGRIFEGEIILIPPSLKISESSSNGSYRNTDEVWWRYSSKMATMDEFVLKNIGLWWSYRNTDEALVATSANSVPSSYLVRITIAWSDTVFRRRNVTRRRISNTVLQPRYWGR